MSIESILAEVAAERAKLDVERRGLGQLMDANEFAISRVYTAVSGVLTTILKALEDEASKEFNPARAKLTRARLIRVNAELCGWIDAMDKRGVS
jgi:hypothetical protein